MKKKLLYAFALVGLISVCKFIYDLVKYESDAVEYLHNCEEVKIGMTLKEAKKIMGDLQHWKIKNKSTIWTYINDRPEKTYYLTYPAVFAASTGTEIYFDPDTQIVTKVICGE